MDDLKGAGFEFGTVQREVVDLDHRAPDPHLLVVWPSGFFQLALLLSGGFEVGRATEPGRIELDSMPLAYL